MVAILRRRCSDREAGGGEKLGEEGARGGRSWSGTAERRRRRRQRRSAARSRTVGDALHPVPIMLLDLLRAWQRGARQDEATRREPEQVRAPPRELLPSRCAPGSGGRSRWLSGSEARPPEGARAWGCGCATPACSSCHLECFRGSHTLGTRWEGRGVIWIVQGVSRNVLRAASALCTRGPPGL